MNETIVGDLKKVKKQKIEKLNLTIELPTSSIKCKKINKNFEIDTNYKLFLRRNVKVSTNAIQITPNLSNSLNFLKHLTFSKFLMKLNKYYFFV